MTTSRAVDTEVDAEQEKIARALYILSFGVNCFYTLPFIQGLWEKAKQDHLSHGQENKYLDSMRKAKRYMEVFDGGPTTG